MLVLGRLFGRSDSEAAAIRFWVFCWCTQGSSKQICLSNHFFKLRVILLIFDVDSANAFLLRRRIILLGIYHLNFVFFCKVQKGYHSSHLSIFDLEDLIEI